MSERNVRHWLYCKIQPFMGKSLCHTEKPGWSVRVQVPKLLVPVPICVDNLCQRERTARLSPANWPLRASSISVLTAHYRSDRRSSYVSTARSSPRNIEGNHLK